MDIVVLGILLLGSFLSLAMYLAFTLPVLNERFEGIGKTDKWFLMLFFPLATWFGIASQAFLMMFCVMSMEEKDKEV